MTSYSVFDAALTRRLSEHVHLRDAVDALTVEQVVHQLHPAPGGSAILNLVITADTQLDGPPGDIIVLYAAGGGIHRPQERRALKAPNSHQQP